jgi:hypothetical protein
MREELNLRTSASRDDVREASSCDDPVVPAERCRRDVSDKRMVAG